MDLPWFCGTLSADTWLEKERKMTVSDILKQVRFVVDAEGNKTAVQLDLPTWEALVEFIESSQTDDEATAELVAIPGLVEAVEQARQRVKAGQFTSFEDIRRNV
jgi:hypothetical protein